MTGADILGGLEAGRVQEYERLVQEFACGRRELVRLARNGFLAAGVEPELQARLLQEFDQWVAAQGMAAAGAA